MMQLVKILEDQSQWRRKSLLDDSEQKGISLYAKIHQNPRLFRHLYTYFVYRFDTPSDLRKITELL